MVNYIKQCGTPQCKLCRLNQLDNNCLFYGNLSKVPHEITFHQTCKTASTIYLISCKHPDCIMKYVGKTKLMLNRRMSLHRGNILFGSEGAVMLQHFTNVHNISDMQIKAIEICNSKKLDERGKYWMDKLNVAFPYGLNDRLIKKGVQDLYSHVMRNESSSSTVYELFDKVPSTRTKKAGRRRGVNMYLLNQLKYLKNLLL